MKKLLLLISSIFISARLFAQVSVVSQTNATCPGMCNGAVTLSITGGIMPYTVGTLGGPSSCTITPIPNVNSNTVTISGLCPCLYNFFVQDASFTPIGGVAVTILSPPPINITFSVQNICCNGQCTGAASAFVFGGTAPYNYMWTTVPVSTGSTVTNQCAGTYDLCVTDMNGCIKCQTVAITQPAPFVLTSSVMATSCATCCNGSIMANASGGNPGYTYTVFPGNMTNTSGTFSNMCSGMYSVCASDAGCCATCIGVTVPISTGINNLNSRDEFIEIYPNPSSGSIDIRSVVGLNGATYEVIDMLGKKIQSGKAEDLAKMSPLHNGVYIVVIRNKDSAVISRKKIIVEK